MPQCVQVFSCKGKLLQSAHKKQMLVAISRLRAHTYSHGEGWEMATGGRRLQSRITRKRQGLRREGRKERERRRGREVIVCCQTKMPAHLLWEVVVACYGVPGTIFNGHEFHTRNIELFKPVRGSCLLPPVSVVESISGRENGTHTTRSPEG